MAEPRVVATFKSTERLYELRQEPHETKEDYYALYVDGRPIIGIEGRRRAKHQYFIHTFRYLERRFKAIVK